MEVADRPPPDELPKRAGRWQFSLRFMFAITTIVAVGTFLVTYALRALGWELTLTFVGVLAIIATTAESPRLLDHFRLEKQHRTIGLAAISIVILIETMLGILLVFQAVRYAFFGAP